MATVTAWCSRDCKAKRKNGGKGRQRGRFKGKGGGKDGGKDDDQGSDSGDFSLMAFGTSDASTPNNNEWILDSGSSDHLVGDVALLNDCTYKKSSARIPNGEYIDTSTRGTLRLRTTVNGKTNEISVRDVAYVPGLPKNLLSLDKLLQRGLQIDTTSSKMTLVHKQSGTTLFDVARRNNIWLTTATVVPSDAANDDDVCNAAVVHEDTLANLHQQLGHIFYKNILALAKQPGSGIVVTNDAMPACFECAQGKQTRNAQPQRDSGQNAPTEMVGGVICSDIKGPMTPRDRYKNRYMVNFVDFKSNYVRVFLGKTKDSVAKRFEEFVVFFERQFDCRIKVLRTDGGQEYQTVNLFCDRTGIGRQVSQPYTQASNGKAERMHRTLLNTARSMVFGSMLPVTFWGDALMYAAYVHNRSPTRANRGNKSPLEVLTGKVQDMTRIVRFGSACTVHKMPKAGGTWKSRAANGRIVGIDENMKGYRVFMV